MCNLNTFFSKTYKYIHQTTTTENENHKQLPKNARLQEPLPMFSPNPQKNKILFNNTKVDYQNSNHITFQTKAKNKSVSGMQISIL